MVYCTSIVPYRTVTKYDNDDDRNETTGQELFYRIPSNIDPLANGIDRITERISPAEAFKKKSLYLPIDSFIIHLLGNNNIIRQIRRLVDC